MAEQQLISDIVKQQAYDQITKLQSMLDSLDATLLKLVEDTLKFNQGMGGSSGGNFKPPTAQLSELEKIKRQLIATEEKLAASQTIYAQLLEREKQALKGVTDANKDFVKANNAAEGSIEAMRMELKALQKEYDGMAASERNAARGSTLVTHLKQVDSELKKLEANTGRFQRNVGNYASGFNSMGNAVSQITREMPNFAQSMQIGIMSLTNNVGAFKDAIDQIKAGNKQLQMEGKPTVSVLSQVGKALLSWNTLIMAGVTLMSAYGAKIWESISRAKEFADSQSLIGDAIKSTDYKSAVKDLETLKNTIELAKQGVIDKKEAVELYNKTLGDTLGSVKTLDEAEQMVVKNGEAWIEMTLLKAAANLALDKAAEKYVTAEMERRKRLGEINPEEGQYGGFIGDIVALAKGKNLTEAAEENVGKFVDEIKKEGDDFKNIAKNFQEDAERIRKGMGVVGTAVKSNTKVDGKNKSIIPSKTIVQNESEEYQSSLESHDNEVYMMNQAADERFYKQMQAALERRKEALRKSLQDELDLIKGNMDAIDNMPNDVATKAQEMQSLTQNTLEYMGTLSDLMSSINDIHAAQVETRYNKQLDYISGIEKAELESLEKRGLTEEQQAEERKRIEIETSAARKKAERERIEELRRAAKFQRALDVAQVISNTALGVTNAYAKGDPYTAAVRAFSAAAIGVAQLARIFATPLPEYAKGTDNHKGGLAIVGEKGAELVIEPSGKKYLTPSTPTVMDLPARTKVKTHEELIEMVYNQAIVNMANKGGTIGGDNMQEATLKAFEDMSVKVDKLTQVMEGKNFSATFYGNTEYIGYVKNSLT